MTDWWSTDQAEPRAESVRTAPEPEWDPKPQPSAGPEPETETPPAPPLDRRRKLILSAAGAAVVGVVLFATVPHGGSSPSGLPGISVTAPQGDGLPSAGGGPDAGSVAPQESNTPTAAKVVTMAVAPSGTGRVGAVVKVTIYNGTDDAITVMSSMMKGDDRSAVLGEGTLAPGARAVQPGETVTGTVEFATKQPPAQVVLFDIGGNVVAASG